MLQQVSENAIQLRLLEAVENGLTKDSPFPLHQSLVLLRQDMRIVVEVLRQLGFVVAEELTPTGQADLTPVLQIFATGQHYAPGRTKALQESWPALYEALDNAVEQLHQDVPHAE